MGKLRLEENSDLLWVPWDCLGDLGSVLGLLCRSLGLPRCAFCSLGQDGLAWSGLEKLPWAAHQQWKASQSFILGRAWVTCRWSWGWLGVGGAADTGWTCVAKVWLLFWGSQTCASFLPCSCMRQHGPSIKWGTWAQGRLLFTGSPSFWYFHSLTSAPGWLPSALVTPPHPSPGPGLELLGHHSVCNIGPRTARLARKCSAAHNPCFPPMGIFHPGLVRVISTENGKPGTFGEFQNLCGPLFSPLQSGRLLLARLREGSGDYLLRASPRPPRWSTPCWVCLGTIIDLGKGRLGDSVG